MFLLVLVGVALWTTLLGISSADLTLLPCPVRALIGMDCPGCGISRASIALTRGQFREAWDFHPFVYLLVPLAGAYCISPKGTAALWGSIPRLAKTLMISGLLLASLGRWVWQAPWA